MHKDKDAETEIQETGERTSAGTRHNCLSVSPGDFACDFARQFVSEEDVGVIDLFDMFVLDESQDTVRTNVQVVVAVSALPRHGHVPGVQIHHRQPRNVEVQNALYKKMLAELVKQQQQHHHHLK